MRDEPESEEQMTALFSFMAAGMECGLDLMEQVAPGSGGDGFDRSESQELVANPVGPGD